MEKIIKNCPAIKLYAGKYCCNSYDGYIYCQDCPDCLIKQIVKRCNIPVQLECDNKPILQIGVNMLATSIIELLEIEECE